MGLKQSDHIVSQRKANRSEASLLTIIYNSIPLELNAAVQVDIYRTLVSSSLAHRQPYGRRSSNVLACVLAPIYASPIIQRWEKLIT